ncbi:MAG: PIN domain-containing protein [bacterium]
MSTILLDTDIAIDFLRGHEYAKDLILPLWQTNSAFFSILSTYELYAGMKEKEAESTDNFINACNIEPLTLAITKKGGEIYRNHRRKGTAFTAIDCMILASAIINNRKIATRNIKHYPLKQYLLKLSI